MLHFLWSQVNQAGAIEINFVVMNKIGVFVSISSRSPENDGVGFFIHFLYTADNPVSGGDLVFYFPGFGVVPVKMIPAVAF